MVAPFLLFLLAFAVRVAVAVLFVDPAYPDALYYTNLGHVLASGGGFSVDYIWNFVEVGGTLPATGVLPIPSNAHWMPLAALVQVPFVLMLGPTPVASGLPFWLIAAAVAPLTWFIGRDAGPTPVARDRSRSAGDAAGRRDPIPGTARQLRPVHVPRRS